MSELPVIEVSEPRGWFTCASAFAVIPGMGVIMLGGEPHEEIRATWTAAPANDDRFPSLPPNRRG